MHVTDFDPTHILMMNVQPHQAWMRDSIERGYGNVLLSGACWTIWNGDTPIACMGRIPLWAGNEEVWTVFDRDAGAQMTPVFRETKRRIALPVCRRLQAYVDVEFAPAVRWMLLLGFTVEGRLTGYFPNGNDAFLFSLIRQEGAQ